MKKVKAMLRSKNVLKIVLLSIVCAILVMGYFVLEVNPKELFEKDCIVETYSDIAKCQGKFVTVKSDEVYNTEFLFQVGGETAGRFVDIDIDGMSLIAIVKKDDAKDLFDGEGVKEIRGKLEKFTNEGMVKGYDQIVEKYVAEFNESATEDEIKSTFIPVQLNAYNDSKLMTVISFAGLTIPLVIVLIALIIVIVKTIFIQIISIKTIDKDLLEEELENGPYLYKKDNFILTNDFAIGLYSGKIKVEPLDELVWMYERKITKLGSSKQRKYLILCFNNKRSFKVNFDNKEAEKVIQLINFKKPNMLAGYSKENLKNWKNNNI